MLLDLGEVRGFDYYSGTYFEAYVAGFGASVAGGGRYDQMLGRFGYDCPARRLRVRHRPALLGASWRRRASRWTLPGPDFFIIDFTPEKTVALSLARRLRDLGASVARDIISRGLDESRSRTRAPSACVTSWSSVSTRARAGEVLAIEPGATASSACCRSVEILGASGAHISRAAAGAGMPNIVVVGTQWGDEGKGKVVDVLAPHVNVVARYQGGNNAGHTVVVGREKYVLHIHSLGHPAPGLPLRDRLRRGRAIRARSSRRWRRWCGAA